MASGTFYSKAQIDTLRATDAATYAPVLTTIATQTAPYIANPNEIIPCNSTAYPFTVTLPTAPADKTQVRVKLVTSATPVNAVTVALGGSDKINTVAGPSSTTLTLLNQAVTFQYNAGASVWLVVGDDLPLSQLDARYVTPASVSATYATKADTGHYGYLLATFLGNGASLEKLGLYYSPDGKTAVGGGYNPVFAPVGGVRDPSILYLNGVWHVAYTINNGADKTFGVAHSPDLLNWTTTVVDVSAVGGLTLAWAPELVVDRNGDVYAFFTINASSFGYLKATSADLTAWSSVTGMAWAVPPTNGVIDACFIDTGTQWVMFYRMGDEIDRATAPTLTGTWTIDRTGDWAAWGAGWEAPEVYWDADRGKYRLYLDAYTAGTGLAWAESTDLLNWTGLTTVGHPAGTVLRHGSWIRLPDSKLYATAIGATLSAQVRGAWHAPTFVNGYTGNLEYRLTEYGIQFRGFLTNSGATAMATGGEVLFLIPELQASHPTRDQQMICASDAGGTVRVQFGSGGDVAKFEVTGSVTNLFMPPLINID